MTTNTGTTTISLVEYKSEYDEKLSQFYLPEDQLQFTSLPMKKITDPSLSPKTKHIVILHEDTPIGYFALENGEKLFRYSQNEEARLLTAFSINLDYQGQGLAKKGLQLLSPFVRENYHNINEIVLGVNKRNQAAINLYKKTGFVDHNEVYEGPRGEQSILHLKIYN